MSKSNKMKNKIINILELAKLNNWDNAAIATTIYATIIYDELINPQIKPKKQ